VRYGYVGDTAVFEFDNPKSIRPSKRNLSIAGLSISRPSLDRLFDAVCRQSQSFAVSTQFRSVDSFLKPILANFRQESQPYPVTVERDVPGFVGNRLQHALWREAIALVQNGVCDAATVNTVVKASFGRRLAVLGPLENADLVGTVESAGDGLRADRERAMRRLRNARETQ
jgi:3-hydroxyacyl-CoA dehydrogenase, C-terminal domain